MDFGLAGVAAITVIAYLIGMGCKASEKVISYKKLGKCAKYT